MCCGCVGACAGTREGVQGQGKVCRGKGRCAGTREGVQGQGKVQFVLVLVFFVGGVLESTGETAQLA